MAAIKNRLASGLEGGGRHLLDDGGPLVVGGVRDLRGTREGLHLEHAVLGDTDVQDSNNPLLCDIVDEVAAADAHGGAESPSACG
eukprot:7525194-Lingulodinium_polyedra.AAC.1